MCGSRNCYTLPFTMPIILGNKIGNNSHHGYNPVCQNHVTWGRHKIRGIQHTSTWHSLAIYSEVWNILLAIIPIWYLISGIWHLIFDICYLVSDSPIVVLNIYITYIMYMFQFILRGNKMVLYQVNISIHKWRF